MDREEFFRLKKVQGKKKRAAQVADNERRAQAMQRSEAPTANVPPVSENGGSGDMLNAEKDTDVIF